MRIAVCDDQMDVLNAVEDILKNVTDINIENIESYQDIRHLREEFQDRKQPDILIMDICHEFNPAIPETEERQEGIDYAYELNQEYPELQIIYMTGDTTIYFQRIFLKPVNLLGYLKKPVDPGILKQLLKIASEKLKQDEEKRVTIMCQNHKQVFYLDEIRYLESNAHRTIIHTLGNEYVCYEKISELEKKMGDSFVRCHQSFLVNMKCIRRVKNDAFKLEDGYEINISKRRYVKAKEKYFDYLDRNNIG